MPFDRRIIAMKMHNRFETQDTVHRDAICSGLSLETSRVRRLLCFLIARTSPYAFVGTG
jgi:hypothetical protein